VNCPMWVLGSCDVMWESIVVGVVGNLLVRRVEGSRFDVAEKLRRVRRGMFAHDFDEYHTLEQVSAMQKLVCTPGRRSWENEREE